jgi:hypothetical protein
MSAVTVETGSAQTSAYGGLIDAIGGIAAGVLAILGLTGFDPEGMASIATIVLGAVRPARCFPNTPKFCSSWG